MPQADPGIQGILGDPLVRGILAAVGAHVLVLDADLRLQGWDEGAASALGLAAGPDGPDVLPALVNAPHASRGFRLCPPPIPLGPGGPYLWVFQDQRDRERREEREMVFLHALLAHPRLASGAGPGASGPWDLALSLYREVVAADPGRGRREVEGVRELEAGRPAGPHPVPEAPAGAPLVLVADDSPMVRRLLEAVLGRECRVISAGDGAEAVALAREHRPDLVLMDILMPNQDGYEACADLKADPGTRDIPVLFLTALQGEMEEVRALEAGAIDFIQKPIVASTVLARVRAHVALKRSKDQLLELAVRDGLTSLANRRQFDQVLRQEWQRGRRQEKPLSLVMGDIDSFKKFNDAYGHPRGDECLKAVAGIFRSAAKRPGDLAARYGGEEFICLLPGTDEVGARTVAEEIREGLEALAIPHGHSPVSPWVTVSLGAATIVPGFQEDPTVLVEAADRAMYEVKRRARERANPPEAPGRMG